MEQRRPPGRPGEQIKEAPVSRCVKQLPKLAIAPSLLASDFAHLADEIARVTEGGADLLHVDVMDGHFVPNLTMGPAVVERIRAVTGLCIDVHLMITDPGKYVEAFAAAGADIITFHAEVVSGPDEAGELIDRIHGLNCDAGISVNPDAPVELVEPVVADVDLVLVMSVYAGFGGQQFMEESLPRLRRIRKWLGAGRSRLEVDGGINRQTAALVAEAGADILIAGTAIFAQADYAEAIGALRSGGVGMSAD